MFNDDMDNDTQIKAINIAIVGHTNAGKTSLIRTLLRDDRFGEIDDAAGTTRYVEKSSIYADEAAVLTLFDTPGFEDSSALLDTLELLTNQIRPKRTIDVITTFIEKSKDYPDFDQETKVLRQSVNSDVLLYMIDVREPVLGKYIDEIEILSMTGLPILPAFNFIAGNEASLKQWRDQMIQFNLHSALEFDTVAYHFEAEKRLYQKLQSLIENRYDTLQELINYRQQVWLNLQQAAAQRIFQLLIQVACYRQEVDANSGVSEAKIEAMQKFVRKAENNALQDLLAIFAFTQIDVELQQIAVKNGNWELDIFSPQMLKDFGLDAGATALKGAAAGAGIDLMVGGMSLGAAAALGAAIGAGWATLQRYHQELQAAIRGNKWLCVDDNTVSLLYLRQQALLHKLTQRGHAAQNKLSFSDVTGQGLPNGWAKTIKLLRQNPAWQDTSTDENYLQIQKQVVNWLIMDQNVTRAAYTFSDSN